MNFSARRVPRLAEVDMFILYLLYGEDHRARKSMDHGSNIGQRGSVFFLAERGGAGGNSGADPVVGERGGGAGLRWPTMYMYRRDGCPKRDNFYFLFLSSTLSLALLSVRPSHPSPHVPLHSYKKT